MTKPLTILQVIPRMRAGGAEMGCLQIAEAQVKAGMRALVASEGGRLVERLEAIGAHHVTLPLASKNPASLLANARALARIVRAEGVDIIHARSRAPAWSALWAARRTGAAFMTTYHGEYSERGRLKNLYNSVMVRGEKVIAVSSNIARLITERYATPADRIAVIHRAYDPDVFDPARLTDERRAAMRHRLAITGRERVMMLVGRVSENKSAHDLVEAVGRLHAAGRTDLCCVFPGEIEKPDYVERIRARAATLGLSDRVHFPGNIDDVPAALSLADITFNISRTEGLPRVVIESQAMGVPVVVTDSGPGREVALTPPETPLDEATGLRVPQGDPEALAAAIAEMLSWPEGDLVAMGQRGAAHVRARYTLAQMCARTLDVYREIAARRADVPRRAGADAEPVRGM